jgi:hypothetical protein
MTGGGPVYPTALGTAVIETVGPDEQPHAITLGMVALVEDFPLNVFSGERFYRAGGYLQKDILISPDGQKVATIDIFKRGFYLQIFGYDDPAIMALRSNDQGLYGQAWSQAAVTKEELVRSRLWHRRLGHIHHGDLIRTIHATKGTNLEVGEVYSRPCSTCDLSKSLRWSPKQPQERAKNACDVLHIDVGTITPMTAPDQVRYFLLVTDDYSRLRWIFFNFNKGPLGMDLVGLLRSLQTHFGRKVKTVRCDNAGEFLSTYVKTHCHQTGTVIETSTPYTPEQNGVAERSMRTIVEKARSMTVGADIPRHLWNEIVMAAVYLTNITATRANKGITPYQSFHDSIDPDHVPHIPDIGHLRAVGATCFANIDPENPARVKSDKMAPRAAKGILVGFQGSTQYRIWAPGNKEIRVASSVVFHENIADDDDEDNQSMRTLPPVARRVPDQSAGGPGNAVTKFVDTDTGGIHHLLASIFIECDSRSRVEKCLPDVQPDNQAHHLAPRDPEEPRNEKVALESPNGDDWRQAMYDEILNLIDREVLRFIDANEAPHRPLTAKWVYRNKRNPQGVITKRKARLVARGFQQRHGIDYNETFASTAKSTSWRILLAYAVTNALYLRQMDTVGAYLYGELDEDIYMQQFPLLQDFFNDSRYKALANKLGYGPSKIIKLNRALYGLKQGGRQWQIKLRGELEMLGFRPLVSDPSIYRNKETGVIVATYVDDFIALGPTNDLIDQFFEQLGDHMEMKDLGFPIYFLGVEIVPQDNAISITQGPYADEVIERFGFNNCKPVGTPMDPGSYPTAVQHRGPEPGMDRAGKEQYQAIIGSLIYLTTQTRPDLAFATNLWARFMADPTEEQLQGAKRILRYLRHTRRFGLTYRQGDYRKFGNKFGLHGYADSDYAGDPDTARSTDGHVFFMAGAPVAWSSRRQKVVAKSTTEAEYYGLSRAAAEAAWIRSFLEELGEELGSIQLYGDNNGSLKLSKNPEFHQRTKHIRVHEHYIRQEIEAGHIEVSYVPTTDQTADGFTKPLPKPGFESFRKQLEMEEVPEP